MKLRSGKIVSLIPNSVRLELKKTVDTLKFLLKDDQPLLEKVVELSLLLAKEVYFDDIDRLIYTKYPDRTPGGLGISLLYTVSDLERLIFGNHPLIRKELAKLPIKAENIKKWQGVQQALRTEIKKEVSNMFEEPNVEESSINIIGESEQSFNEMEI
jgi:hypothetical protein